MRRARSHARPSGDNSRLGPASTFSPSAYANPSFVPPPPCRKTTASTAFDGT
jgi:hypothetical protein